MYERLVENWLTSVNELGFQLPFCETLIAEGWTIVHVSTHGRGEHGKDIVARDPSGQLCTFQLKGGDIGLPAWRAMRDEVAELVQLPVRLPGVREDEPHRPYLVTNGELRGDAPESVTRYAELWERGGSARLEIWSRRQVLKRFLDAHGSFLPAELPEVRRFVELFVGSFDGPFPHQQFAQFLEPLATSCSADLTARQMQRAIAGLAITAGYIVEQYSRASNHIAAAEGWTITAAAILRLAERDSLEASVYEGTLHLVRLAFDSALEEFAQEALASDDFVVPIRGFADPHVYGARVVIVFGWLSTWALDRMWRRNESIGLERVIKVFHREWGALRFTGEVDWPLLMATVVFFDRIGRATDAEAALALWVRAVVQANRQSEGTGVPSPYWSHEKVLELANGMLPPFEREDFKGHAYTVMQAMEMLVRRLRRREVAALWPIVTHVNHCEFVPDSPSDYFLWHCEKGELQTIRLPLTRSWSAWRTTSFEREGDNLPSVLSRYPEWILPFCLSFPQRLNGRMCRLVETYVTRRIRS